MRRPPASSPPSPRPSSLLTSLNAIAVERDEAARAAWRTAMAKVDPAQLVFLDATSTPTTLTPLRARAARGQRAYGRIPRGRREAISWLATLTPTGLGESLLVRGAVDRLVFEAFVQRVLVPTLRPGQIVILDNLSVTRARKPERASRQPGASYLSAHLLAVFEPIEQAFAKTKQALRRAGARSSRPLPPP